VADAIKQTADSLSSAPIDELVATLNSVVARLETLERAVFGVNYTPPA
jgi:hypothetical protein